jgi:cytidylate kinase
VITIDGPAGSGKSTTAAAVARRLGLRHLDSGALYRALTLGLMRRGIPEERWGDLGQEDLSDLDLGLEAEETGFRILLDGDRPGPELRSPEVTAMVSEVARLPAARARLLDLQRSAPSHGGIVADGRDMGTVVFPEAALKVFLTAGLETRARRRLRQEGGAEDRAAVAQERARIEDRDVRDAGRSLAPLRRPAGALVVDTTELGFEDQVGRIVGAALPLISGGSG